MNPLEARRRLLGRNVYKRTTEGNPAIAQGSLARRYPGITMQGWTEQNGTPTPETPVPIVSAGTQNQDAGKWEYEVKLTGANLFDPANLTGGEIVEYNGVQCYKYTDNAVNFTYVDDFAENTQYCINVRALRLEENENRLITIRINYTDGHIQRRTFSPNELESFVSSVDKTIESISGEDNYGLVCYLDLSITTLGIGTEPLPYQPYKEQTVTLAADRPLTKWDKLEKRNGQWGWVYKSAEIESYTDESVPSEYYSTTGRLSTGAQVWYETTTETFVPLSESEQEQMNALYTFRPTTVLSNDAGCNMELTYKTKKSLEVAT